MTGRRDLQRDWSERKRRARAVAEHRAAYGDWCPGWGRPGHPAAKLSADHVLEVYRGGDPKGPLQVLCVGCNSAKSNKTRGQSLRAPGREETPSRVTNASRQW